MITNSDVQKIKESLSNTFATKEELYSSNSSLRSDLKSDILNFKDAILHEILAMRQELQIIIGYRDQIEDHKTRIEKLEKKVH